MIHFIWLDCRNPLRVVFIRAGVVGRNNLAIVPFPKPIGGVVFSADPKRAIGQTVGDSVCVIVFNFLLSGPGIDHREASAEGGAIVLGLLVVHAALLNDCQPVERGR